MASSVRVAFAAALIEGTDWVQFSPDSSTAKAARYYNILLVVVVGSNDLLRSSWHSSNEQVALLHRFGTALIGGASPTDTAIYTDTPFDAAAFKLIQYQEQIAPFEHRAPFFFAALACGYDFAFLLELFGNLESGSFSEDGCCFRVASVSDPPADYTRFFILADGFRDGITFHVHRRIISHIVATRSMAARRALLDTTTRPAQGSLLPFIRLSRDDTTGELTIPLRRVTDLYDASENRSRHTLLCQNFWEGVASLCLNFAGTFLTELAELCRNFAGTL
jgi:hypothetical protein